MSDQNDQEGRNAPPTEADELHPDTLLTVAGRQPHDYHGFVNTPLVRASTILFADVDALERRMGARYPYGLMNTPTIEALTDAVDALERSAGTVLVPSGLAAVTVPILAFSSPGTRLLVPDNVYFPTRRFGDHSLGHLGVDVVYYDPMIGAEIADYVRGRRNNPVHGGPGFADVRSSGSSSHGHSRPVRRSPDHDR